MSTPIGKIPVAKVPASQAKGGGGDTDPKRAALMKKLAGMVGGKRKPADEPTAEGAPPPGHGTTLIATLGRRPEGVGDVVAGNRVKTAFFWGLSAMIVSFIVWINLGTLDIVSMTMGEVIPSSQVKTIQHLEGGIVLDIPVREGQKVTKGQTLVELEQTLSGADMAELRVRLNALSIDIARLEAEAFGAAEPEFTEDSIANHPQLVIQAMERFRIRQQSQASRIASHAQAISQRRNEIKEIQARIERQREALKLQNEQISISEGLLKDQLTNRYLHLDLLKKANELQGGLREDAAALNRAKAALQEAQNQQETVRTEYLEEVRTKLDATRLEYRELSERAKKFEDSLRRTQLRSPVDGVIKSLYVTTIGGVIKPGDPVVDIVPGEDRLVIESKLPTQDIGYIEVGQEVVVKLTTSDAARYGSLKGIVAGISPDTHLSPEGVPFYKVRVETDQAFFQRGNLRYHLYPGMPLSTNIRTGKRTIFQYVFDPILTGMGDALQER